MRPLALATCTTLACATAATAQLIPDAALPTNSSVSCNGIACTINDGTIRGVNLYHSFQEFSVPTGGLAYFNNGVQITNILTRVTGGNASNIDGLIRTNGIANLFLLNPNGILFGANARLDMGGTFVATTANRLLFADGSEFSATNPQAPPLLAVNLTPGLQYGASQPGATITNRGNLQVGQDLSLVADRLDLQGQLLAGGQLTQITITGNGVFGIGGIVSSGAPVIVDARGDIVISNGSEINSQAQGNGGAIKLLARNNISLTNGVSVNSATLDRGNAGAITVEAGNLIVFDGVRQIFSGVPTNGVGHGGDVTISSRALTLVNGAGIIASTLGEGDAGDVLIQASDRLALDGIDPNGNPSAIYSSVIWGGVGNGGNVTITTRSLGFSNGGQIGTTTFGQGDAGNVIIQASDTISIDGITPGGSPSGISSAVGVSGMGQGGDIAIATRVLSLTNTGQIGSGVFGRGDAGDIMIRASDRVTLDGHLTSLFSNVQPNGVGHGGTITLSAGSLRLSHGADITAGTSGQGNAGDIQLDLTTLEAISGSSIKSSTFSTGQAGTIRVNAVERLHLDGLQTGIYAATQPGSTGNGGNIIIDPDLVQITNGATIATSSLGSGIGGTINLMANRLFLDTQGSITATTTNRDGGNIFLHIRDYLLMRNNSLISATAGGIGNGGNVTIHAPFILAVQTENSDIIARASKGRGGRIDITAQGIFGLEFRERLSPFSDINASSEFGVNGTVTTPGLDPSRGLTALPINLADPAKQIVAACSGNNRKAGEFIITGKGGMPNAPDELLTPDRVQVDLGDAIAIQPTSSHYSLIEAFTPDVPQIVEMQGWVKDAQGRVFLVAEVPTATVHNGNRPSVQCLAAIP